MSFYQYLQKKAASFGHQCPQCGKNDGYFAINGKCNLCQAPLIRYSKELTLLFSLEAFMEFINYYAKQGSAFDDRPVRELLERTIIGLREIPPKVQQEDLAEIQRIFTSGHKIEEINGHYTFELNAGQTETYFQQDAFAEPRKWDINSHIGAILVTQFITVVKFNKPTS